MSDPQARLRVLLVEDSAVDAELIARALRDGGLAIDVRMVEDEAGLRAQLAGFLPELIVVDWNLPGFSGAGAIVVVREWDRDVPCILVSGSIGEELVVEALRTGATDYVLKHRLEALAPAARRALAEWAGRRESTRLEAELAASQEAMHGALDVMADAFAICTSVRDASGSIVDFSIVFANRAAAAFVGFATDDLVGRSFHAKLPEAIRQGFFGTAVEVVRSRRPSATQAIAVGSAPAAGTTTASPGGETFLDITITPFGDGFFVVLRDVTERTTISRERDRLAAVVEESVDAITIAAPDGLVTYANAAFQALVGLPLAEIVGQPMPAIAGRLLDAETIAWIDARVQQAETVRREVDVRVADGPSRRFELSVSPRRGADGAVSSIVTAVHDVADLREAQADLALHGEVRLRVAEVLRAVGLDTTLEQTAQMICGQLATLPNVDLAAVDVFLATDELLVLGLDAPAGFPLAAGDRIPGARAALLHERLQSGAWAWYATDDPTGDAWADRTFEAGLRASAYGPIVFGDQLVGAVVIGTYSEPFAKTLVEKMPAIASFSSASSGLLAQRMQAMRREAHLRRSLEAVLAARAFQPVFQPIVDLATREILGHEALTRFDSGQRPDLCFAEAQSVRLGVALEAATLEAALAAATALPNGLWLSLNVSPTMLGQPGILHGIVQSADRPIVLEVTEHEPIGDYAAVRDAVRATGTTVRLAVDDAGVGVANFSHIVELRPDFVKIDVSLVRGISLDIGRQAMVVGLQHFARTAGCRLIAEGIETEQEATTLERLGVDFGQGYLFGRPGPVTDPPARTRTRIVSRGRLAPAGRARTRGAGR